MSMSLFCLFVCLCFCASSLSLSKLSISVFFFSSVICPSVCLSVSLRSIYLCLSVFDLSICLWPVHLYLSICLWPARLCLSLSLWPVHFCLVSRPGVPVLVYNFLCHACRAVNRKTTNKGAKFETIKAFLASSYEHEKGFLLKCTALKVHVL